MNLERLRWGEWIAALAGLNLAFVIFRAWYKAAGGDARVTAWDALESGRYLLIATAVLGVVLLLLVAAEQAEQMSFPPGALVAVVGLVCTGYIAYRMMTPPGDADGVDPDIGLYVGLVSALGVAIGGLLSARDQGAPAYTPPADTGTSVGPGGGGGPMTGPAGEPAGEAWSPGPPAASAGWSPAAPAASSSGWSPAAPAAPVPPATAAGAGLGAADRPLQAGDEVALTAGGARFPAGTLARVVQVFGGGALVEVAGSDGVAERFEVPDEAFERVSPGSAAAAPPTESTTPSTSGESWSPAMPAAAESSQSHGPGFGDGAPAGADAAAGAGQEQPAKKVPFWKREIGGKKKDDDRAAAADPGAAAGLAAAPATEEKPGFFKRLFGGGKADAGDTGAGETAEAAPTDTWQSPTPSAYEATEPAAQPALSEPEPAAAAYEPEPEPEPEPAAPEPEPEPEPEPAAPEPEPEPDEPEPDVQPAASEPPASSPEAETTPATDVAGVGSAAESDTGVDEPKTQASAVDDAPPAAMPADDEPKPKRKRSSGSRKVPKEALDVAAAGQPKVGDEVRLKVGGGKYEAGTKGTVVDVFSAGVIVELSDAEGRTERLDLPFEAVAPADA